MITKKDSTDIYDHFFMRNNLMCKSALESNSHTDDYKKGFEHGNLQAKADLVATLTSPVFVADKEPVDTKKLINRILELKGIVHAVSHVGDEDHKETLYGILIENLDDIVGGLEGK